MQTILTRASARIAILMAALLLVGASARAQGDATFQFGSALKAMRAERRVAALGLSLLRIGDQIFLYPRSKETWEADRELMEAVYRDIHFSAEEEAPDDQVAVLVPLEFLTPADVAGLTKNGLPGVTIVPFVRGAAPQIRGRAGASLRSNTVEIQQGLTSAEDLEQRAAEEHARQAERENAAASAQVTINAAAAATTAAPAGDPPVAKM
jgi:hypothetical protein